MDKIDLLEQTTLAFDFVQRLYLEVSYFIKEVEGLLREGDPPFIILRPSGYMVSARSSNGLDPFSVNLWLVRKLAVAFGPEESTTVIKGQTYTKIQPGTRIIYLRIILSDKEIRKPTVYWGVLYDFYKKNPPDKWPKKIEQLLQHFEYRESKFFSKPGADNFEDAYVRFKGTLRSTPLYEINSSEMLNDKIVQPVLEFFRKIENKGS